MDDLTLLHAVKRPRRDHEEEARFHRLCVDSYTGCGGFCMDRVVRSFVPYWGAAAYEYGNWWAGNEGPPIAPDSYLHCYRNEDPRDYADRVRTSIYRNPIKPIVDTVNAFLSKEDAVRDGYPTVVTNWYSNADGTGLHVRYLGRDALFRSQLVGRCFTVCEPPGPQRPTPVAYNLWPSQVLDYKLDGQKRVVGIRYVLQYEAERTMLEAPTVVNRYLIWTPTEWEYYDVGQPPGGGPRALLGRARGANPLGRVPVTIMRWQAALDVPGAMAGIGQLATLAPLAVALYNRDSELDAHLRGGMFAQMVIPGTRDALNQGSVPIGQGNALLESEKEHGITRYVAPPAHIATAYQTRINDLLDSIYRNAVLHRQDRGVAETAVGQRLRFIQTSVHLAGVAEEMDKWEMALLRDAAEHMGLRPSDLALGRVQRPRDFNVLELDGVIKNTVEALKELPLGPVGAATLARQAYRQLAPGMGAQAQAQVDEEIKARTLADPRYQPGAVPTPAQPQGPGGAPGADQAGQVGARWLGSTTVPAGFGDEPDTGTNA